MAISKEKLREMRENSAAGAAKQHAKEQAELDKYMYRRNTEVAQMMSAKERNEAIKKAYTEEGKSVEQIMEAFELTSKRVCKILGISEKPSGVIDAAELSNEEREELTAQAEADAGIVPERAADKPQGAIEIGAVYMKGLELMTMLRTVLDVPENVILNLNVTEGLCELEVEDKDDLDQTARFTWRL